MSKKPTSSKDQNYISNPFKVIFKGFGDLFNKNQAAAIIILAVSLLGYVGNVFPNNNSQNMDTSASSISNETLLAIGVVLLVVGIIMVPILVFITTMYQGFCAYVALETSKGKTIQIGDALKIVLKKFWTLLLINIIVFFKVLGGILLFIVPGVRAALRYKMVHMHVFDENVSASQAISKAKVLTKDHLMEILGMSFAAGIIPLVGTVMDVGGQSVIFKQLNGLRVGSHEKPAVHWLNYLVFIIFAIIVFFAFLAVLAVISVNK